MNKDDVYTCLLIALTVFVALSLFSMIWTKANNYHVTVFHQGKVSFYDGNTLTFEDGYNYSQSTPTSIYSNETSANKYYGWYWRGVDVPVVIGNNYSLQRSEVVLLWLFPSNIGSSEIRRVNP